MRYLDSTQEGSTKMADVLAILYKLQESEYPLDIYYDPRRQRVGTCRGPVWVGTYDARAKFSTLRDDILFVWPEAPIPPLPKSMCQRGHDRETHSRLVRGCRECTLCRSITDRERQSVLTARSGSLQRTHTQGKRPKPESKSAREACEAWGRERAWSEMGEPGPSWSR